MTFTEKVVPVVIPESKPLELRGVHGSLKEDWVTECGTEFLRKRQTRRLGAEVLVNIRENEGDQCADGCLNVRRRVA